MIPLRRAAQGTGFFATAVLATLLLRLAPAAAAQACGGDCSGDLVVTVNEVLTCVNIGLGNSPVDLCHACDSNGDGTVTVDEIIKGVSAALVGCPGTAVANGICRRPGPSGLVPCAPNTAVVVFRCDDRSRCLNDSASTTMLQAGSVDSTGQFSLTFDRAVASGAPLMFDAEVDTATHTAYRILDFGVAGGAASVGAGHGATLDNVVIDPSAEAAVRLLAQNGLDRFTDEGISEIIDAVRMADANIAFAGLDAAAAGDLATETASGNPQVIDAIRGNIFTPTPTVTSTAALTLTPSGTPAATNTPPPTPTPTTADTTTPTATSTLTPPSSVTTTRTPTATQTPTATTTNTATAIPTFEATLKFTQFSTTAGATPYGISSGPDGNVWFTELDGNKIGRLTADGVLSEFPIPTAGAFPLSITAGPDGNLWFTEGLGKIARITIAGSITEFALPPSSDPVGIVAGPDGNMWFTEDVAIGRLSPQGSDADILASITEFPIPSVAMQGNVLATAIAAGPDGNLWFTERNGNNVGRITPAGAVTEFPIPRANSNPQAIVAGADGNLWFTEFNGKRIGRSSLNGSITEFPAATNTEAITLGPDGNVWFTEANQGGIGRITPNGTVTEFPAVTNSFGIATGSDGLLWATQGSSQVARIVPPRIIEFPLPAAGRSPSQITSGPDGNLWLVEENASKIARVIHDGSVTEFTIPTGNSACAIASAADANLWFLEKPGDRIGRITPAGTITEFDIQGLSGCGITSGPDQNLWITDTASNRIGRVDTAGALTGEFTIPSAASLPQRITDGPDGNLWFTEKSANKVGRVTTGGTFVEFTIPTASSDPFDITSDGTDLWFTETAGNNIGRITANGTITEFPIPTGGSAPHDIVLASDGNLWFTELAANQLGRITKGGLITEFPIPRTPNTMPDGITLGADTDVWFTESRSDRIGRIAPP